MYLADIRFPRVPSAAYLTFDLRADHANVARARHRVRAHLLGRRYDEDTCETALLLVSELFTNAVLHTASATIGCAVRQIGRHLRIEVRDEGGAAVPEPGTAGIGAVHGRGLVLVEALSATWGVARDGGGKTVWCDVRNGTA
ncbi:ATP-binding protein [Streptomyces sp. CA-111067]|uniref:ATP-binding protein n=1 Tax=Streptomyces sp. CA-111067 TaxID=3240046 RepID=UPI003D99DA8C